jgi:LacI family repressor for deo operon, udp, cdd, tsx, nupC, and nupG
VKVNAGIAWPQANTEGRASARSDRSCRIGFDNCLGNAEEHAVYMNLHVNWVEGGFDGSHGETGIRRLLELPHPPTAVIAANDLVAIGAATALRQMGKRVPEDVSIIGYDNIRMAELYEPALTTIAQPVYQMGVTAMRAIIRRIDDRSLGGAKRDFSPRLIVRSSTQPLRRNRKTRRLIPREQGIA